jgi:hypothetical protein
MRAIPCEIKSEEATVNQQNDTFIVTRSAEDMGDHLKKVNYPTTLLGDVFVSTGAREIPQTEIDRCLVRHVLGDWGALCDEDHAMNVFALRHLHSGGRIMSSYPESDLWIVTESEGGPTLVTTVFCPREY